MIRFKCWKCLTLLQTKKDHLELEQCPNCHAKIQVPAMSLQIVSKTNVDSNIYLYLI